MRVFIDATEYVSLFKGEPHKVQLDLLERLIKAKKFTLLFPKITCNEVHREIKGEITNDEQRQVVLLSQIFPEASKIRSFLKIENNYSKSIKGKCAHFNKNRALIKKEMANKIFTIFQSAEDLDDSGDVLKLAKDRQSKSFPPGKDKNRLGDQLAWELLLSHCKDDDLIIVSGDPDWRDLTDPDNCKVNPIIKKEWSEDNNENKIELMDNLNTLLKKFDGKYEETNEVDDLNESTQAIRPTVFPFRQSSMVSPSHSHISGVGYVPIGAEISSSTSWSPWEPMSGGGGGTISSACVEVCFVCGRMLNTFEPYVVQNGSKYCRYCAPRSIF